MSDALVVAEIRWQADHGKCSMCDAGDKPSGGLHRSQYACGNFEACVICINALPPGEICRACKRKNVTEFDS